MNRDPGGALSALRPLVALAAPAVMTGLLIVGWRWVEGYIGESAPLPGLVLWVPLAGSAALFHSGWSHRAAPPAGSRISRGALLVGKAWSALVFLGAALALVMLDYRVDGFYDTPDTAQYLTVAQAPLASQAFLAGQRPFTFPLALKAFGVTLASAIHPIASGEVRRFTQFQALTSLASFVLLGLAAGLRLRSRLLRGAAAIVFIGLAVGIDVGEWNRMVLSESLAISLLALVVAGALLAVHLAERRPMVSVAVQAGAAVFLGALILLFSNTRDANAYVVLAAGGLLLVAALAAWIRTRQAPLGLLTLGSWMILVGLVQVNLATRGERWLGPFSNVLRLRILPSSEAWAFFEAKGAPLAETAGEILEIECLSDGCPNFTEGYLKETQAGAELLAWLRAHGQGVYGRYLIATAGGSLLKPIADLERLLGPDSTEYRLRVYPDPQWFPIVRAVFHPRPAMLIIFWAVLLTPALVSMLRVPSRRTTAAIVLLLIALTYPHMFVVWHGDAVEIERHATLVAVQIRLAVWLGTLFGLDLLWQLGQARLVGLWSRWGSHSGRAPSGNPDIPASRAS